METYKEISTNDVMRVGKYRVTFTANIFPSQITWLIDNLRGLLETTFEVVEGKPIRIYKVENENDKIYIWFELLNNPVPVAVVIAGILGLLGVAGTLLILDKVEAIAETPMGFGAGLGLSLGSLLLLLGGAYFLYKQFS